MTLWAMLGLELATVPADKVQDPERTINRATLFGTAGAGGIYILVCSAVVLMLPVAITSASAAPFADFVSVYAGTNAGTAIAAIGAISALGALNGWIMCQGRITRRFSARWLVSSSSWARRPPMARRATRICSPPAC
ncbi:amino acid permease [Sphingorhabdus sp.]|uniref:amino acid permease n=1 Tax=Sphingorhabdus sp. TaxID=1902408 RepID=UPI003D818D5D